MTYVSLDADGVQDIIDKLTDYKNQSETSWETVTSTNRMQDYPASLAGRSNTAGNHADALDDEVKSLKARLAAAKAANEGGITTTADDGTIAYWLPEGTEDTDDNVKTHNQVDKVNQARADAEKMVDYSINGCTPEEWDELIGRVQANQDDAVYANTILANIGPGRLLDLPADIQDQLTFTHPQGISTTERPDAGEDLADALGHMLATASRTWDDAKAEAYANRLVDYAEEKGKNLRIGALNQMLAASRQADIDSDGTPEEIGLDYNDVFLVTLASRLEDYSPDPGSFQPQGRDAYNKEFPIGPTDNPLAGVVHAMTGNLDAATEWLVPNPDGTTTPVSANDSIKHAKRIQQLIEQGRLQNQKWTTDWAMLADRIDRLSSPSMADPARQYKESARATATSGILNGLGSGEDPLSLSPDARRSVAAVMARHPQGVDASTEKGNEGAPLGIGSGSDGGTSYYPLFTDRALTNLIGQVSLDEWASTTLGGAMTDYHTQQLQDAVNRYNNTGDAAALQEAVRSQSRTNAFFAGAAAHQLVAMAEQTDSAHDDANSVTSFLAGLIPVAGSVLSLGVDLGKPFGTDNTDQARNQAEKIESTAAAANNRQLTLALLNSGLYNEEDLKAVLERADNLGYVVDIIIDQDGNNLTQNMTPEQLADSNTRIGLSEVGNNLQSSTNPDLNNLTKTRKDGFDDGWGTANPDSSTAPSHTWGEGETDAQDDED
ncbi:hypothetical protein GZ998_08790 [Actinomyces sp. 594]|uniref:DUF6571 family protein n=1 Tax=Actinomyces sp. 594 TaxID=2057793 RepID=UPI001C59D5A5|nr:DUF6571 family protein [Actinomyces sp. 594]MBW3069598.1 hypothetical protein [Actinomyces sp. 594]